MTVKTRNQVSVESTTPRVTRAAVKNGLVIPDSSPEVLNNSSSPSKKTKKKVKFVDPGKQVDTVNKNSSLISDEGIDMTFSPDADFEERIEVVFQLDDPVEFKEDVAILIKDATLLGGKELSIEPGSATAAAFPADRRLYGRVQGNVVQELESFVAENREAVGRAIQNLEQVSAQLTDTQGTLGRLINDPDLAGEVQAAVRARHPELGGGAADGEGAPALFVDGRRLADPKETVARAQLFGAKVRCGEDH